MLRRASAIATVPPMARHLWGRIHATEAFAALRDTESARAHAEAAARVAGFFDSSAWRAMAETAAAHVAAVGRDRGHARERFHAAADLYERAGQPYWTERSLRHAEAV